MKCMHVQRGHPIQAHKLLNADIEARAPWTKQQKASACATCQIQPAFAIRMIGAYRIASCEEGALLLCEVKVRCDQRE